MAAALMSGRLMSPTAHGGAGGSSPSKRPRCTVRADVLQARQNDEAKEDRDAQASAVDLAPADANIVFLEKSLLSVPAAFSCAAGLTQHGRPITTADAAKASGGYEIDLQALERRERDDLDAGRIEPVPSAVALAAAKAEEAAEKAKEEAAKKEALAAAAAPKQDGADEAKEADQPSALDADELLILGAGVEAANGSYKRDGECNGKPKWAAAGGWELRWEPAPVAAAAAADAEGSEEKKGGDDGDGKAEGKGEEDSAAAEGKGADAEEAKESAFEWRLCKGSDSYYFCREQEEPIGDWVACSDGDGVAAEAVGTIPPSVAVVAEEEPPAAEDEADAGEEEAEAAEVAAQKEREAKEKKEEEEAAALSAFEAFAYGKAPKPEHTDPLDQWGRTEARELRRMAQTLYPPQLDDARQRRQVSPGDPTLPPVPEPVAGQPAPKPLDPSKILHLYLNGLGERVTELHVAAMPLLKSLAARDCRIATLTGAGLEKCERLFSVDLAGNRIVNPQELAVFAFTPALLSLDLRGNPVCSVPFYRACMLATTARVRGAPRGRGLLRLDGNYVSMQERIGALQVDGFGVPPVVYRVGAGQPPEAVPTLMNGAVWELCLETAFGQLAAHGMDPVARWERPLGEAPVMSLQNCPLSGAIDLRPLQSLRVIDLRGSPHIRQLVGLNSLRNLEVLDTRGCVQLAPQHVLDELTGNTPSGSAGPTTTLRCVACFPGPSQKAKADPKVLESERLRHAVATLERLLPVNHRLWWLEGAAIPAQHRLMAWRNLLNRKAGGPSMATPMHFAAYRTSVMFTVASNVAPHIVPSWHPDALRPTTCWTTDVEGGTPAGEVKSLNLSFANLEWLDLTAFTDLRRLQLRGNALKQVQGTGLHLLTNLRTLDVAYNSLQIGSAAPRNALLAELSHLRGLQALAVDGNMETNPKKDPPASKRGSFVVPSVDEGGPVLTKKGSQFWRAFIAQLPQTHGAALKPPQCPTLRYLNGREIEAREMIEARHPKAKKKEKEALAQHLALVVGTAEREHGEAEAADKLDLAGHGLKRIPAGIELRDAKFANLHELLLASNALSVATLLAAGVDQLPLRVLDIRRNKATKLARLGDLLNRLSTTLEEAYVEDNPCFPRTQWRSGGGAAKSSSGAVELPPADLPADFHPSTRLADASSALRSKLLAFIPLAAEVDFKLKILNDVPVGIAERIAAFSKQSQSPVALEQRRTTLLMHQLGLQEGVLGLDLCLPHCSINEFAHLYEGVPPGAPGFKEIRRLDLSNNRLVELKYLRLPQEMPFLVSFNISGNPLGSASAGEAALEELELCPRLRELNIANSFSGSNSAQTIQHFFDRLPLLIRLDGHTNPKPLSEEQLDAVSFLLDFGVSGNALERVDLRSREIADKKVFALILEALARLRMTNSVDFTDNPIVTRFPKYRIYAIHRLHEFVTEIDGQPVSGDQVENAHSYVDRKGPLKVSAAKIAGHAAARNKAEKLAEARILAMTGVGGGGIGAAVMEGVEADGAVDRLKEAGAIAGDRVAERVGGGDDGGAAAEAGGGDGDDDGDADDADGGGAASEAEQLALDGMDDAREGLADAARAAETATLGLLTKMELIVGFFQVYGVVIRVTFNIDLDINWPNLYVNWTAIMGFIPNLMVDLDFAAVLALVPSAAYAYIRFGVFALWSIFVLSLYRRANNMEFANWKRAYITRWSKTSSAACRILFVAVILAVGAAGSIPIANEGNYDINTALAAAIVLVGICLVSWAIWRLIVGRFRGRFKKYGDGSQILRYFLRNKRRLLRAVLFIITVSYIPVSTEMLNQWANNFEVPALNAANCTHVDGDGIRCCIKAFPTEPCVTSPEYQITPLQIASIPFILLFTIGVPIFFALLVKRGTREVERAGFDSHSKTLKREIKERKDEMKRLNENTNKEKFKTYRKEIKQKKKLLSDLWRSEVNANPKSQTYLYAPFARHARYQKVLQIFFRVALLIVVALVPIGTSSWATSWAVSAVLGVSAVAEAMLLGFDDVFENVLSVSFAFTNAFNMLLAVIAGNDPGSVDTMSAILVLMNVCAFVVAIFIVLRTIYKRCKRRCGWGKQPVAPKKVDEESPDDELPDVQGGGAPLKLAATPLEGS